jgi:hypothetical protein
MRPHGLATLLVCILALSGYVFSLVVLASPAGAVGAEPSTLTVNASPSTFVTGQPISFTASVAGNFGAPQGTLTFSGYTPAQNVTYTLCVATIQAGAASCTATNLMTTEGDGKPNYTQVAALYSGDGTYAKTGQSLNLLGSLASTTISLASSSNPSVSGSTTTLSATVSVDNPGAENEFQPGLYIQFMIDPGTVNGEILCNAYLTQSDPLSATCAADPSLGSHIITAQLEYGYLAGLASSTATLTQVVGSSVDPNHGYWLVGSDGGIFTFGSAQFLGSTGGLALQRPVVGITPTADRGGYWLVASDGGIFSFGDLDFYGSIPGLGLAPAGTPGSTHRLNAPIVGMVPSADGGGYFMVASDGGVFAFGDAKFEGSCPGIGGCAGAAVAVMPDASGNGYWLVTATGHVYSFGDAIYHGAPGPQGSAVTSAVRTPDGGGYWILLADGVVYQYGDAATYGDAAGLPSAQNPATAIFATDDGGGFWIASANGTVWPYGDARNDGDMAGTKLSGSIVGASGY